MTTRSTDETSYENITPEEITPVMKAAFPRPVMAYYRLSGDDTVYLEPVVGIPLSWDPETQAWKRLSIPLDNNTTA